MFVASIIFWICFPVWQRPIKPLPNCGNGALLNISAPHRSLETVGPGTCSITGNDQNWTSLSMNTISQRFACCIRMLNSNGFTMSILDTVQMLKCSFRKSTRNILWNYIREQSGISNEFRNDFVPTKAPVMTCCGSVCTRTINKN